MLYSLKELANLWYYCFTQILSKYRFNLLLEEPYILVRLADDIYIILYIDDAVMAVPTKEILDRLITDISNHFIVKDLNKPT